MHYFSIPLSNERNSSDYPALLLYNNCKGQCTKKLLKFLDANNKN